MKRKILVLDAHTNGYEAALRFIRKQGWKRSECEIIFCGSHSAILKRLAESPAFAVVPIHNSTKGIITSVTHELAKYRTEGYSFDTVDTLVLRINHYLMAQPHIGSANELERVFSKAEAMGQCDKFLRSIGLTPEKRSDRNSTGNAARQVSSIQKAKIGAIAPRSAAKAYGLKILAEKIQDDKKNLTTFQLLENKQFVRLVTVGIIGINGGYGKLLRSFFSTLGCTVIGSDRKVPTDLSNIDVVQKSDVVIFSIPIQRTVETVKEVLPHVRKDQLLMDVTSVKEPVIRAMLKSKAQVVGLHPMFAPELGFAGQTIVVCPARCGDPEWKTWVMNVLAATGCRLKWTTGKDHDNYMATVQVSPQSANFVNALLIMTMGVSTLESLDFTSPFYRVMFSLMGRFLSQNPEMYASIFMKNPATVPMLRKRVKIERELIQIIKKQDMQAFMKLFEQVKQHFGKDVAREANELFQRLNAVLKTISNRSSVILEFERTANNPGLLEKVAKTFRRQGVNLTGINFAALSDRLQFAISFDGSKDSTQVQRALKQIAGWTNPRVQVVT
jgi:prephenate dehydrogenase